MTDERRAELLAKKAELSSALEFIRDFNDRKRTVNDYERKYGPGHDGVESSVVRNIEEIDRELDYESFLISFARRFHDHWTCSEDMKIILGRYIADRTWFE